MLEIIYPAFSHLLDLTSDGWPLHNAQYVLCLCALDSPTKVIPLLADA